MPLDHYDTAWLSSLSSAVSLDDLYMKFSLGSRDDRISLMKSIGPALFAQLMLTVKDRSVFDGFLVLRSSLSKAGWTDAVLPLPFSRDWLRTAIAFERLWRTEAMYEVVRNRNRNLLPGEPDWVGLVGPYFESGRIKSKLRKAMPGHKRPLWEGNSFRWVGLAVMNPGKWYFVVGDLEQMVGVLRRKPASALHAAKAMASLLLDKEAKRTDPDNAYPTFWKKLMEMDLGRQVTDEEVFTLWQEHKHRRYLRLLVTNPA